MKIPDSLKFTGKDASIKGIERMRLLSALASKMGASNKFANIAKTEMAGRIPNLIIGSYGYPDVNAGFLSSEGYDENDNPIEWSRDSEKYDLLTIVKLRNSLLNSKFNVSVKSFNQRFADKIKEVSLASAPVDAEVTFEKAPVANFSFSMDTLPYGPSAPLKNLRVENPKVSRHIAKVEGDTDLKATEAISSLYGKGIDEHYITRVFSGGNMGVKSQRKMVPTKWSITAVDDTLGKSLLERVKHFDDHPFSAFFGGYMGNYYLALVIPGPWSYELFETYVGKGLANPLDYVSATDYEGPFGRKDYASSTVGGYYAARLAVLEYFMSVKKKGRVLLLRFITDEYWVPMGVWVVRQASRKTFEENKIEFDSLELLKKYSYFFIKKKYNLDLKNILTASNMLKNIREQQILDYY